MPRIAELREINGEVWCRVGHPDDFPSGIAIWTPDEVEKERRDAVNAYIWEQKAKSTVENDIGYGRCPHCGSPGVERERRPNGNDKCSNGHVYPSASAIHRGGKGK